MYTQSVQVCSHTQQLRLRTRDLGYAMVIKVAFEAFESTTVTRKLKVGHSGVRIMTFSSHHCVRLILTEKKKC